jgi:hypothetical protein
MDILQGILALIAVLILGLGTLYLFVRFIKYAWRL